MSLPVRSAQAEEVSGGLRFEFGENWSAFLASIDEERVRRAEDSLRAMLECETLAGTTFLDAGCGSGLFSLAARRLGARVHAFDFDPRSVACCKELRRRLDPDDEGWVVEEGSVLDADYLARLGTFDVVYSWGVLHHTGRLWDAVDSVASRVAPGGRLFIAIYNDQGRASRIWLKVKRAYCSLPRALRWGVVLPAAIVLWGPTMLRDLLRGHPMGTWRTYHRERGMSPWRDVIDWVGGLPFEVARPEEVFDACRRRGFTLERLTTLRGLGNNQFVFKKTA